jgi:hypothetical protein
MSKFHKQSESMKALEQSLNDHMEICSLKRQVKRLKAKVAKLKAEVERLRASSFVTAVPCEQYDRVVDAGDSIISITCQHVHPTMANLALREWKAAKEGKAQP